MTEFTSKTYNGQTEFEVIIRTDREEHYKHAEDFARKLTGHAKPMTNGDRFRALSDEELYLWARKQIGCGLDFFPCGVVCDGKCDSFDEETCKAKIMEYLKQPAEENANG